MFIPNTIVADNLVRIENLINKLSLDKEDYQKRKIDIYNLIKETHLATIEMCLAGHIEDEAELLKEFLETSLLTAFEEKDENLFLRSLKLYMNMFKTLKDASFRTILSLNNYMSPNYEYRGICRFSSRNYYDKYLHPSNYELDMIFDDIDIPEREVSFLNIDCGNSEHIPLYLKNKYDNITTYGTENDDDLYYQIKDSYDKMCFGLGRSSSVSNNAFDIVYKRILIAQELDFSLMSTRRDREDITTALKYVRNEGIVIFNIPYYRLYRDLKLHLSRELKDVKVYLIESPIAEDTIAGSVERMYRENSILIVGRKKKTREPDKETFSTLTQIADYMSGIREAYVNNNKVLELPNFELEIKNFRGSKVDKIEMSELLGKDDSFVKTVKEEFETKKEKNVEPLLPFNLGQIGLILTSGRLDGLIAEGTQDAHIIKGRVVKDIVKKYDDNAIGNSGSEIEVQEVHTNKVEIMLLDKNGEFKRLA